VSIHPAAPVIWDTTGPRHLTIADHADVLFSVTRPHVPRVVADPNDPYREDLISSPPDRLSELAAAERHFLMRHRRGGDIEDLKRSTRLAELRRHPDLVIVDLDPTEAKDMMIMSSQALRTVTDSWPRWAAENVRPWPPQRTAAGSRDWMTAPPARSPTTCMLRQ